MKWFFTLSLLLIGVTDVGAWISSSVVNLQLKRRRLNSIQYRAERSNVNGDNREESNDNKAMKFLKKIGKVGGAANRDFRYAIGPDEGSSGKTSGEGQHASVRE